MINEIKELSAATCKQCFEKTKKLIDSFPPTVAMLASLARDKRLSKLSRGQIYASILCFVPTFSDGAISILENYILNSTFLIETLSNVDEEIIREHWHGKGDPINILKFLSDNMQFFVASGLLAGFSKLIRSVINKKIK